VSRIVRTLVILRKFLLLFRPVRLDRHRLVCIYGAELVSVEQHVVPEASAGVEADVLLAVHATHLCSHAFNTHSDSLLPLSPSCAASTCHLFVIPIHLDSRTDGLYLLALAFRGWADEVLRDAPAVGVVQVDGVARFARVSAPHH
jgi:hypothetical protein